MPRIPTVNAEKTLSVGNQPTMPAGFGTAPGQAMQKLGSAIGSFGAALEAGAEQEDPATELQNQIAIANHEAAKQRSFMELQNTHVVGSDPTERVTQWNNQWAERDNQAYGALRPTTTRNANRYKLHQVESHNRTLINSDQWKYKAREEYVGGQVSKLVNDSVKDLVGQGPEAIKQNIPGLMDQVDKVISNPSISPRMRERLRGEAATLIYQSTLDGLPEAERLPFIEGKIKEWSALSKEREAANPGGAGGSKPSRPAAPASYLKTKLAKGYEKRTSDVENLNPVMQDRLAAFVSAAEDAGHDVRVLSGHRSNDRQAVLWRNAVAKYGSESAARRHVAPPGSSSHNTGMAVDLQYGDRAAGLGGKKTEAVKWAHANAKRFGLHFRLGHEDWHIEPSEVTRGGNYAGGVKLSDRQFYKGGGASGAQGAAYATAMPSKGSDQIDPTALYHVSRSKIEASPLNGFVPKDGAQFGITKGTPDEWARFFVALTRQESGLRVGQRNADGSIARFKTTPRGEQSYGPGQFKPGEYGLKNWDDVNNPDKVVDAYIAVAKKFMLDNGGGAIRNGNNSGMSAYFGSIRRPNEVIQHIGWVDKNVQQGEAGTSQSAQARGVPTIRDAVAEIAIKDRSRLLARHQKFLEEQAQMQQVFRMVKGEVAFDKYDTDQKKMVDTWAEKTGLGQKLLSGDLRVVGAIVESTKALNHLPTPFSSTLRTMAKSKDPKAQGTAYEVAASMLTNNPNALDGDGLKDLREEAEAYREMLTGPSKMTTEEAIGRIQEAKSDEWRKKVDARKEDAKKHSDAIDAGDTLAVFAGFMQRNFGSGGELNPQRADLILGEYRERFREHFTRWGDKDLAKQLAGTDMKRVYGMSAATGSPRVMRYPPERSFPPIGKDGHKYIQDDLKAAVQGHIHDLAKRSDPKAKAPEIDMNNVDLIYVENRTAQQIAAGNMPRYRVIYKDPKTGIPMVLPYNWTLDKSDIEAAKKSAEKGFNEAREKAAKQAEDMKPTKESRKAMEAYKPDKLLADGVKAVLGAISPDGKQKDAARRQLDERMKGSEELNNRALSERDSRRENARKSGTIPDSFRQLSGGGSE